MSMDSRSNNKHIETNSSKQTPAWGDANLVWGNNGMERNGESLVWGDDGVATTVD